MQRFGCIKTSHEAPFLDVSSRRLRSHPVRMDRQLPSSNLAQCMRALGSKKRSLLHRASKHPGTDGTNTCRFSGRISVTKLARVFHETTSCTGSTAAPVGCAHRCQCYPWQAVEPKACWCPERRVLSLPAPWQDLAGRSGERLRNYRPCSEGRGSLRPADEDSSGANS